MYYVFNISQCLCSVTYREEFPDVYLFITLCNGGLGPYSCIHQARDYHFMILCRIYFAMCHNYYALMNITDVSKNDLNQMKRTPAEGQLII